MSLIHLVNFSEVFFRSIFFVHSFGLATLHAFVVIHHCSCDTICRCRRRWCIHRSAPSYHVHLLGPLFCLSSTWCHCIEIYRCRPLKTACVLNVIRFYMQFAMNDRPTTLTASSRLSNFWPNRERLFVCTLSSVAIHLIHVLQPISLPLLSIFYGAASVTLVTYEFHTNVMKTISFCCWTRFQKNAYLRSSMNCERTSVLW